MRLPSVVSPRVLGVRGKRLSEWSVWQLLPTNNNLLSCSEQFNGNAYISSLVDCYIIVDIMLKVVCYLARSLANISGRTWLKGGQ